MKKTHVIFRLMLASVLFLQLNVNGQGSADSPILYSKRVADKIIRETSFDFMMAAQKSSAVIQSVDFAFEFPNEISGAAYALSYIKCGSDKEIKFGISHDRSVKIWLNGSLIYSGKGKNGNYSEIAYDIYSFPGEINVTLKEGENRILIKSELGPGPDKVSLALLGNNNLVYQDASFSLSPLKMNFDTDFKWILAGPFKVDVSSDENAMDKVFTPENSFGNYYKNAGSFITWKLPETRLILKDIIHPESSFQQHSYFEWHYANGQTMLSLVLLADAAKDTKYLDHVIKYCTTTLSTYDYFKYQYEVLNEKTGYNYRIFRKAMLDDSSAPTLPFVELYNKGNIPESKFLIDIIADYITSGQSRLKDGTLCRPEPELNTIWADDLFMGVPFLLRYAEMTGDERYYDDASLQVINFPKYLFDKELGISFHAWYDQRQKNSVAHWGRANGWMAWAVSEALLHLPKSHKNYNEILGLFKRQMGGLVNYQDASGFWHQVLDKPDSYLETSCTAMFTIALARGIRNGWLDKKYKENVMRAWEAIKTKIAPDGTVSGICQGTGIEDNLEFYYNRKTPPHDPRGLGSVITAGIEVQLLTGKE